MNHNRKFRRRNQEKKMRFITLSRVQFNDFVYPAYCVTGAESEDELETSVRVIKKFKKVATPEEMTKEQIRAIEEKGSRAVANLKLNEDSAEFELEEDEWKFLLKKYRAGMKMFTSAVAEDVMDILTILKDPPTTRNEQ